MKKQGTFSNVVITNKTVIKISKKVYCYSAIRDIIFSHIVPFVKKPINYEIGGYTTTTYPYMGNTILESSIYKLDKKDKCKLMFDLLIKIKWLKDNNIRHNDLMIGNLLYDGKTINIIDWGLASFRTNKFRHFSYSEYYLPFDKNPKQSDYKEIWAFAITCFLVFDHYRLSLLKTMNKDNVDNIINKTRIPDDVKDFLLKVFKKDIYSAEQCLSHGVFNHFTNPNIEKISPWYEFTPINDKSIYDSICNICKDDITIFNNSMAIANYAYNDPIISTFGRCVRYICVDISAMLLYPEEPVFPLEKYASVANKETNPENFIKSIRQLIIQRLMPYNLLFPLMSTNMDECKSYWLNIFTNNNINGKSSSNCK